MRSGVTRKGHKVTLDLLACQKQIAAGTFSEQDRQTLERILPGMHKTLSARADEATRANSLRFPVDSADGNPQSQRSRDSEPPQVSGTQTQQNGGQQIT